MFKLQVTVLMPACFKTENDRIFPPTFNTNPFCENLDLKVQLCTKGLPINVTLVKMSLSNTTQHIVFENPCIKREKCGSTTKIDNNCQKIRKKNDYIKHVSWSKISSVILQN